MNTSTSLPFIVKTDSITVVFEDGPRTVARGHSNFELVRAALKDRDFDKIRDLMFPAKALNRFTSGDCTVEGDHILYRGKPLQNYLVKKVLDFQREGLPWQHLLCFLDRLMKNPSMRAREELYKFLETEDLPITEDGCFLAYKSVRKDMKDWHTGTIDNSVGRVISMERAEVDDNQQAGCSHGLHAGSMEYVRGFHGESESVFLIVKIDPADVVCIPSEDVRKLRCCRYEVTGTFTKLLDKPLYNASGTDPIRSPLEDEDDDSGPASDDFEVNDEWEDVA